MHATVRWEKTPWLNRGNGTCLPQRRAGPALYPLSYISATEKSCDRKTPSIILIELPGVGGWRGGVEGRLCGRRNSRFYDRTITLKKYFPPPPPPPEPAVYAVYM